MSTKGHSHSVSSLTRMNLNETLRYIQQSIEGLARQFHSVARDVEELKRGKSSASMDQRVGDHFGRVNSPHHRRPHDNMSTQGYHDMSAHNPYPFHEGRFKEDHKLEVEVDIINYMKGFQYMKHDMRMICLTILERILMLVKHTMVAKMQHRNLDDRFLYKRGEQRYSNAKKGRRRQNWMTGFAVKYKFSIKPSKQWMSLSHRNNIISHSRFSPSQTNQARNQLRMVTNDGGNRRIHREQNSK
ncbi:hypothetical protein M9H77_12869 [Catharanthus roseus]|uniref:Uncharacterized protein n=1 Tax=Catharanthus roseus TaxID=4058 RepID=A0ACC0BIM5_CATRO|nr:hypothetical protein M9H77_12869 [Catharanthus roseus]